MNNIIGFIIISIGVAFDVFGCIGIIRLPDVYNRLQAATKCVTLGTCGILFGIFVMNGFNSLGIKVLVAIPFIFLTSPTAAHALANGAHHFGVKLWEKSVCDKYEEDKKGIK
ncbi:MAG: Na+/H+ antiporter subunit G [bacterium (Candidatus Stahlbacteria) CG23_combo_of_CG06-09_8_20_14_all_34_7]|nr:MAG: Na+/H+ antiporter subunit G [bacterium (Candidatus Stahlbacteria) CG23_combo_of_CG06-09_8_20_14_all_34_7]